ncbi:MAG: cbb3-type cytochrome c oxidase subunit I [Bacteroidia bacterium]|nr:cbb3-type cytochrome c oxidase subunit I [Bacteroidia bacterium]MCZ2277768.1 cbb3-type cytochrome c oxidase subunit I [Bacteroidia bacterium]
MKKYGLLFISLSLGALILGAFFGVLAAVQYVFPDFLKEVIAFNKMRPFHVSTVLAWIILSSTGGIYFYLQEELKLKPSASWTYKTHFWIFVICAIAIYVSYFTGQMGGREYLEFFPLITIPVLAGWALFGISYFKTTFKQVTNWPVYLWMWGTGIVFMIYHLTEAHLWLFPYFREYFIRDFSIQWKSYGSFVGSWNMLVYGTLIFVMHRLSHDETVARGKKTFFFYFLGLTNLMLGWAHHTYFVPMATWVRFLAYLVSMTEWLVLLNIIHGWSKNFKKKEKSSIHHPAYSFVMAADYWIFINVFIALLISIPFINYYTHGTRITVMHSMGTTIGINTNILFASLIYISVYLNGDRIQKVIKQLRIGFWLMQSFLLLFLISLLWSGIKRSIWMYSQGEYLPFSVLHEEIKPALISFLISGFGLFIALALIAWLLFRNGIYLAVYKQAGEASNRSKNRW